MCGVLRSLKWGCKPSGRNLGLLGVVVYEPLSGFPHTLVLIGGKIPVDLFGICGFGSHDASRHLSRLLMCHLTDLPTLYLNRFSGLGGEALSWW